MWKKLILFITIFNGIIAINNQNLFKNSSNSLTLHQGRFLLDFNVLRTLSPTNSKTSTKTTTTSKTSQST